MKKPQPGKSLFLFAVALIWMSVGLHAGGATTTWTDEFDGAPETGWAWMNPDDAGRFSLTEQPGYLTIPTQSGGGDPPNGAMIRPAPAGDFVIETHVLVAPDENFQKAGLLIFGDRENVLILSRAYCSFVDYGCVRNGIYFDSSASTDNHAKVTTSDDEAWLRLTKTGSLVRAEYSENGTVWQLIGEHQFAWSGVPSIGIIANGRNVNEVPASFDFFRVGWEESEAEAPAPQETQTPAAQSDNSAWADEFDGTAESGWAWLNPSDAARASLTERSGYLTIPTQPGAANPLNGAMIRTAPGSDFVIETHVLVAPNENFQRAGLLIFGDMQHFLVLGHAYCGFVDYGCVRNGIYFDSTLSTDNHATATPSEDEAWLRLTKTGNRVRAEYSSDGAAWQLIGEHAFTWTGTPSIGIIADGNRAGGVPAEFDFFRVAW
ncbi:DUF1349 domain-containing protein [Candidatus Bipolaricaulota bacterium]|nr:DUF1349 domain-containing protein [Candidatus Bipolaricaulota bacterium]